MTDSNLRIFQLTKWGHRLLLFEILQVLASRWRLQPWWEPKKSQQIWAIGILRGVQSSLTTYFAGGQSEVSQEPSIAVEAALDGSLPKRPKVLVVGDQID